MTRVVQRPSHGWTQLEARGLRPAAGFLISWRLHLDFPTLRLQNALVRVIKRATLEEYGQKYPQARLALRQWLQATRKADWKSIQDVRKIYPHADAATVASGNVVTIFNIHGNEFRLIVVIKYNWGAVYVRDFLTHAEYDKDRWKGGH